MLQICSIYSILRLPSLRSILLLIVVLTSLTGLGGKATAMEYNLHVGPNGWSPFVMVKRDGHQISHYGALIEFLDQFENAYPEFTRKHVLSTRKRVNKMMAKGETVDVMLTSPLFVSSEVLEHYKFTATLVRTHDKVVSLKDQNFQYNTPHDLIDKKVGTIRGYSYGHLDFLLNFDYFEDIRVDSHSQAIGMLSKNRVDAYIGNSLVSPIYIKDMRLDISDFVFSEQSLYEFNIALAVNKRHPDLYEKLNLFSAKYVSDGKFDELLENHIDK